MMSEEISQPIKKVVKTLEDAIVDVPIGKPSFGDKRYHPFKLSQDHFYPLPEKTTTRKVAFVDGGTAEILSAPNFAIGLNRIYFSFFQGDQRLEPTQLSSKIDFFTVCYASIKYNEIIYKTELIPLQEEWKQFLPDKEHLEFSSFDKTLINT